MKKIVSIVLMVVLLLSITACSSAKPKRNDLISAFENAGYYVEKCNHDLPGFENYDNCSARIAYLTFRAPEGMEEEGCIFYYEFPDKASAASAYNYEKRRLDIYFAEIGDKYSYNETKGQNYRMLTIEGRSGSMSGYGESIFMLQVSNVLVCATADWDNYKDAGKVYDNAPKKALKKFVSQNSSSGGSATIAVISILIVALVLVIYWLRNKEKISKCLKGISARLETKKHTESSPATPNYSSTMTRTYQMGRTAGATRNTILNRRVSNSAPAAAETKQAEQIPANSEVEQPVVVNKTVSDDTSVVTDANQPRSISVRPVVKKRVAVNVKSSSGTPAITVSNCTGHTTVQRGTEPKTVVNETAQDKAPVQTVITEKPTVSPNAMIMCPKCGKYQFADREVCGKCGHRFVTVQSGVEMQAVLSETTKNKTPAATATNEKTDVSPNTMIMCPKCGKYQFADRGVCSKCGHWLK